MSVCVRYCFAVGRTKAQEAAAQPWVWTQVQVDPRLTSIFEPNFQQNGDDNPTLQVVGGLNAQLGDKVPR